MSRSNHTTIAGLMREGLTREEVDALFSDSSDDRVADLKAKSRNKSDVRNKRAGEQARPAEDD